MTSPEDSWWSVRAGEYVLGTLSEADRYLFEKILYHDTAIQTEVAYWEQAFAALNDSAPQRVPDAHLWPRIASRIRHPDQAQDTGRDESPAPAPSHQPPGSVHHLPIKSKPRTRLWPTIAGLATAACLVLSFLLVQQTLPPAPGMRVDGVAVVLSDEGRVPYYLIETDYENAQVRVTALSPPALEQTQDFQLWQALPDRSAVRPVVLLPEDSGTTVTIDVDSLIIGSDLFGVSIEPIGAPTDSGPTGPVVAHGDYLTTRAAF